MYQEIISLARGMGNVSLAEYFIVRINRSHGCSSGFGGSVLLTSISTFISNTFAHSSFNS